MLDPLSLRPIRRDFETVKVNTLQDSPGGRCRGFSLHGWFSMGGSLAPPVGGSVAL